MNKRLCLVAALAGLTSSAWADSATWLRRPENGDWNSAANWTPGGPPNGSMDTAIFEASTVTEILIATAIEVGDIKFGDARGVPYAISVRSAGELAIGNLGIVNQSGVTQNFTVDGYQVGISFHHNASAGLNTTFIADNGSILTFFDNSTADGGIFTAAGTEAAGGCSLVFRNNSTAGHGFFTIDGSTTPTGDGGFLYFQDQATAGNGIFVINDGACGPGDWFKGGYVAFTGQSTAGNAEFTVNGATLAWGDAASVTFYENSTADHAYIAATGTAIERFVCPPGYLCIPEQPNPQARVVFSGSSSAGNATLVAKGGPVLGGAISLDDESTADMAHVQVVGNGIFYIGGHNDPGVMIGSLEGDGHVSISRLALTIGRNNLSTNFSGKIHDNHTFGGSVTKVGTGTLTLSGGNDYIGPTMINGGTLAVTGSVIGPIEVNNGGTLRGTGSTRAVTVNDGGIVAPGGAESLNVVGDYLQNPGGTLKFEIANANASSGQLNIIDNAVLDGTLEIRFTNGFLPSPGQMFTLFHVYGATTGSFSRIIFPDLRNGFEFQGEIIDDYYQLRALNSGTPSAGFLDLSTRMRVGTGDNALIAGFAVTGPNGISKRVILRAIGPSLAMEGNPLSGRLTDPTLELRDSTGALLYYNDNWTESAQLQEIIDTGIAPGADHEAAIVVNLAPGSYTAVMRGSNNGTGTGIVEVYDLTPGVSSKLTNISTRGLVQIEDDVMIGGFIADNSAMHVIIRALGPSLAQSGVPNPLADPTLALHDSQGALLAFNDDWQDTSAAAIENTGIAPANDKESAILATLLPGAYTAVVRGKNDSTGVGLIEVYDLQ